MGTLSATLRARQKEHAFLLLTPSEFDDLSKKRSSPLPLRHEVHFTKVLKRTHEWQAIVGDGCGRLKSVRIKEKTFEGFSEGVDEILKPRRQVTLLQAWLRNKALSFLLQKTAELGVTDIVLTPSDYSTSERENLERLYTILENACMQAYNPFIPRLHAANVFLESPPKERNLFFGDLEASKKLSEIRELRENSACFVNGPEGGFSPRELDALRSIGQGLLLSENVLRSETAAIIAIGYLCQIL